MSETTFSAVDPEDAALPEAHGEYVEGPQDSEDDE